jgi:ubiquinone/menaquinone biosynthesis C-methylase UbiE
MFTADVQSDPRARGRADDQAMAGHPIFARLYDRMLAKTERSGLDEMRHELIPRASGRTLELGAGTGHNLAHYTDRVSELVLSEPDPHMASRLRERLQHDPPAPSRVEVIEAPAEHLPYDDGSFDTVVSTLVFCTVEDPSRALAEARRLLVEGGALLFIEHVRSDRRRLAWWQDRLERPWGFFAGGCHPNRPTERTLADAGLWIEQLDRDRLPAAPPIVKPLIRGLARRPS